MKCIVDVCCLSELRASGGSCLAAGSKSGLPLPSHKCPPDLGVEIQRAVCHRGR